METVTAAEFMNSIMIKHIFTNFKVDIDLPHVLLIQQHLLIHN